MKKQEIIDEINSIASEFLCFETTVLGIRSYNKERLIVMLERYRVMIRLYHEYIALISTIPLQERKALALGADMPNKARYKEAVQKSVEMHKIWRNNY